MTLSSYSAGDDKITSKLSTRLDISRDGEKH